MRLLERHHSLWCMEEMHGSWISTSQPAVVESEFAWELFGSLKKANTATRQDGSGPQKQKNDKLVKEPTVKEKDLVMLKVFHISS